MECLEQRQVAHVADEDAALGHGLGGPVQHRQQIAGAGEVLRHRVDDHGVEAARLHLRQIVGQAVFARGLRQAAQVAVDLFDRLAGGVDGAVLGDLGRDAEQHQAGARTDLEDAFGAGGQDAVDGALLPVAHFVGGERQAVVAVVPAGGVEGGIGRAGLVGPVPDIAPFGHGGGLGAAVLRRAGRRAVAQAVGDQLVVAAHHHGAADVFVAGHGGLDLAQFDAEAPQLDLAVVAAQHHQLARLLEAGQVAGAVQGAGRERVGAELRRRLRRVLVIAARHAGAADAQLAGKAGRHRRQVGVQHVQLGVGDGLADDDVLARAHLPDAGPHGGLGRAIHVPHRLGARQQLVGQRARQRFAAAQQALERHGARPARLQQQLPGGGRGLHHGDGVAAHQVQQRLAVQAFLLARDHHAGAADQRQEQLQRRDVEGNRGHREQAVAGVAAGRGAHRQQEVAQRPVSDFHALGLAGGPRGEDDVGQVVGLRRGRRIGAVVAGLGQGRAQIQAALGPGAQAGVARRRRRDQQRRLGGLQHLADALGRERHVDRHVGGAGLEHGQQRHDHVDGTVQAYAHQLAAANALAAQHAGHAVGGGVQFAIRHGLVGAAQRHPALVLGGGVLEQFVHHRAERGGIAGGVELLHQRLPFAGRQGLDLAQLAVGRRRQAAAPVRHLRGQLRRGAARDLARVEMQFEGFTAGQQHELQRRTVLVHRVGRGHLAGHEHVRRQFTARMAGGQRRVAADQVAPDQAMLARLAQGPGHGVQVARHRRRRVHVRQHRRPGAEHIAALRVHVGARQRHRQVDVGRARGARQEGAQAARGLLDEGLLAPGPLRRGGQLAHDRRRVGLGGGRPRIRQAVRLPGGPLAAPEGGGTRRGGAGGRDLGADLLAGRGQARARPQAAGAGQVGDGDVLALERAQRFQAQRAIAGGDAGAEGIHRHHIARRRARGARLDADLAHGQHTAIDQGLGPHQRAAEGAVVGGAHHGGDLLGVLVPVDQAFGRELRMAREIAAPRQVLRRLALAAGGQVVDQRAEALDGGFVALQAQRQGRVCRFDRHRDALEDAAAVDDLADAVPGDGVVGGAVVHRPGRHVQARVFRQRAIVVVDAHAPHALEQRIGDHRVVADTEEDVGRQPGFRLDRVVQRVLRDAGLGGPRAHGQIGGNHCLYAVSLCHQQFAATNQDTAVSNQKRYETRHDLFFL
ncbi:Uncharacterised protein [Achromobacter xylosoxidans]|nr:Uncharacterised protein [Achromobacter xylosoxidans]